MTDGRRRRAGLGATLAVVGLVSAGCSLPASRPATPGAAPRSPGMPRGVDLALTFDDDAVGPGSVLPATSAVGTSNAMVSIMTHDGGRVLVEDGPSGSGARFPAVPASSDRSPAAALVVRSTGLADVLAPGPHDVTFGAGVVLDAVCESAEFTDDTEIPRRANDQLNGVVDNVYVEVQEGPG